MFNGPFSLENGPFFVSGCFCERTWSLRYGVFAAKDGKLYQEPAPHPLAGKPAVCS